MPVSVTTPVTVAVCVSVALSKIGVLVILLVGDWVCVAVLDGGTDVLLRVTLAVIVLLTLIDVVCVTVVVNVAVLLTGVDDMTVAVGALTVAVGALTVAVGALTLAVGALALAVGALTVAVGALTVAVGALTLAVGGSVTLGDPLPPLGVVCVGVWERDAVAKTVSVCVALRVTVGVLAKPGSAVAVM